MTISKMSSGRRSKINGFIAPMNLLKARRCKNVFPVLFSRTFADTIW